MVASRQILGSVGSGFRITRTSGREEVGGRSGRDLQISSNAATCVARWLDALVVGLDVLVPWLDALVV